MVGTICSSSVNGGDSNRQNYRSVLSRDNKKGGRIKCQRQFVNLAEKCSGVGAYYNLNIELAPVATG